MDILLHICCGPCLIYPFNRLKVQGFNLKGFFYNPNIYQAVECIRRQESLELLSQDLKLQIKIPEQQESEFTQAIESLENTPPQRCLACWRLRLEKTAGYAKENGFKFFSTTLLVSPYQNHEMLKQLGEEIAQDTGVDFYYEDFRPGFKTAYQEAKQKGLYLQKYCWCKYSIRPRTYES